MPNLSLGIIEVLGLPAAVEAADVACKTADVTLIGYETTDGMGMVAVKIEGQVSAVTSAVAAGSAAAARITKVFATSIIARPSDQLPPVVFTAETVGLATPKPAPAPVVEPEPVAEPVAEPVEETLVEPLAQTLVEPVEPVAAEVVAPVVEVPAPVVEPGPVVEVSAVAPRAVTPKVTATRRTSAPKARTTKK